MRFGVLGPLAVWTADGDPVPVPEAKVRALLAVLLLEPDRVVSADRLVEDLWGGGPPARPARALQTLVSRLRGALAPAGGRDAVVHRPPGYLLRTGDDAVDAGRFIALAERARHATDPREGAALSGEALAQWRGPAFADFADEPFARAAVARLEERRLLLWEEYAETRLRLGEHGALAVDLKELTERHPLRERLREARMRALYGAGRPSEALDVYQDLRRRLDEELGLTPGPALVSLQRKILRQDPAAPPEALPGPPPDPPRPRTNLPAQLTGLIGRSRSVADIRDRLRTERLVTLAGPGGVGKTRLALEAAGGLTEPPAGGVWLVELGGLPPATGPEPDGPAEVVAAALGIRDDARPGPRPVTGAHPLADRLADTLRDRPLLLVLDNCEHIVESVAALVRILLRAAPGLRVLATSREPLGLTGEQLWPVPPLDVPPEGATAADVARSGAVRLLVARAAAAAPGFALTEANADDVAAICRRMDGIPLAIELASTRIRALGTAGLAERLDDRFGLLTAGRRDAPARQRTLRAVIDWSWELLTAPEQAVLSRLAVHADGCSLATAEALCSGGAVTPAEVVDLLARLVDRSLVVVAHGTDGPRYRLLESLAAYCAERLRETAPGASDYGTAQATDTEYDRLRRAHAHYYTALAERADAGLCGAGQRRSLARLDTETANLRCALDTAVGTGDAPLARRLVHAMAWYWYLRGRLTEAARSLATALAVPDPAPGQGVHPAPGRAAVRAWHAGMTLLAGEPAGSPRDPGAPLRLHEAVTDPGERARAGWFLAQVTTVSGVMTAGEELVRRSLDDFRALDDRWGVAAALGVRAVQRRVRGELAASRRDGERSLTLFREIGDRWGQLQAAGALGRIAEIEGDYPAAEARHREGLRIAEELTLWTEVSVRWSELGRVALLAGDGERADAYHERGRRLAVEHGDRRAQEFAEVGLALGARRAGRLDAAEAYLRTWLEWNRRFAPATGSALLLTELGFVAESRGDAGAALSLHTEGLAAARGTGDPRAVALALEGLAGAHRLAGRHDRAAGLLGSAARARASVGAPLPSGGGVDAERISAAVRAALGEARFLAAYAGGAEDAAYAGESAFVGDASGTVAARPHRTGAADGPGPRLSDPAERSG
ncbi:BTAD domain-containing putative transcriptional regulator [Streptomyces sp. NPDC020965]|uniref:BTAD domain-containing putative transcriptional regulator n=1 Tax=Streptomyces sp. NPDC020965 TaxID=3365105 RepID=UPI0037AD4574